MANQLVKPGIPEKIEPGAILYSSWGYDQTNIDFYYVTRTTKSSAWIVPMSSEIEELTGFMSENVVAGEPQWFTHCASVTITRAIAAPTLQDYACSSGYNDDECQCHKLRPVANKPEMHRIRRYSYGDETHESLRLESYSQATVWAGSKLYASHYA